MPDRILYVSRVSRLHKLRRWLRDLASRLILLRLANWYDARHADVCRADIIPALGLGYDLGRVWREGLLSFRGGAKRCEADAARDGLCWCGKKRGKESDDAAARE